VSHLAGLARARLEKLHRQRGGRVELAPMADWVVRLNPGYSRPYHLQRLYDLLDNWQTRPFRALVSIPPRHSKTESCLAFYAKALREDPTRLHTYITYSGNLAKSKSRRAQAVAKRAGVKLAGKAWYEWTTPEGGGLKATSVTGELTGHGITGVGVIDDPVKDRLQAESPVWRERFKEFFTDTFMSRVQPGASVLVMHTRWHPDDPIGWLSREQAGEWEVITFPALSEDEEERALWPEVMPREFLLDKRRIVGEYTWASLYQGRPRPRGGAVFGPAHVYEKLPGAYRVAIGLDLAYSEKKASDWSVLVVMVEAGGVMHVKEVVRVQIAPPQFLELCKHYRTLYPAARWRWYAAGTELGSGAFLRQAGIPLECVPPAGDKFVRAIPYAASWNAGRVLVPGHEVAHPRGGTYLEGSEKAAPWLDAFLAEHANFTGVKDPHDDIVDAAVAAHDILASRPTSLSEEWKKPAGRRM
jgi:phage terminase large subunit-like protein